MINNNWFNNYRPAIIILLSIVIIFGFIFLWLENKNDKFDDLNQKISILEAKNDDLQNQINSLSNNQDNTAQKNELAANEDFNEDIEKININTASQEELETIPGIGPTKAQAIIFYRDEHGDFASLEEIENVKGIGPVTFENIVDYLVLEE